ncbi:MAG: SBBP repeat-containing protein [Bacteroidota bacterium]|nr:SBBP repeat-containing protein [Bacteroidota bacterium]
MVLRKKLLLIFIIFGLRCFAVQAPLNDKGINIKSANFPGLPANYGFIENKGQIVDQYYHPNKNVLYLLKTKELKVLLNKNGFSYEVVKKTVLTEIETGAVIQKNSLPFFGDSPRKLNYTINLHRIDILFENIQTNATIITDAPLNDVINYYTPGVPETGVLNIHRFKKIRYQNVYKNIDVEFVINNDKFKYNFVIHPGGNINDIKFKFVGANNTSLTSDGNILIETSCGNVTENIPLSYQLEENGRQRNVKAGFKKLSLNIYGINAGIIDPSHTLIIDPTPWATYFGGDQDDYVNGITNDVSGNLYVSGDTYSSSNIATSGAYQNTLNGNTDKFITKFSSSGTLLWATYYGGNKDETGGFTGSHISIDLNRNVIVTGSTYSDSGIATFGAFQTTLSVYGTYNAFILKLDSNGIRQWATYYGGADGGSSGTCVTTDNSGNIFVAGVTYSYDSTIATVGAFQTISGGTADAFVVKFNSNGMRQWCTFYGGYGAEYGSGIAIDQDGNVIVTGNTSSINNIASLNAMQTNYGGGDYDGFILKLSNSGQRQWSTYFGANGFDYAYSVSCDLMGNILIAGSTDSYDSIATVGAYQSTYGGGTRDAFILKLSPAGIKQWSTFYGGTGQECGYAINTDAGGNIYVGGFTSSLDSSMVTTDAYQTIHGGGGADALILKFNSSGIRQWGSYFGGDESDYVSVISVGSSGNIMIGGGTTSTSGISTTSAYQTTIGGLKDGFIASIYIPVSPVSNNSISANQYICIGTLPASLAGSLPVGGDGSFIYSWLCSTIGPNIGYNPASGVNNAKNYSPPISVSNRWYKRIVISGGIIDTSNIIAIIAGSKVKAGFTVNKQIQCIKENQFIFTDTTSGSLSHLWNFGNGDTSTLINPKITYNFNIANSYWVKLISSLNGACGDSAFQRVFLNNNPNTGIITGDSIIKRLSTITYSVPATIGSSYQWIFTNGTGTSTTNSIVIKWNTIGTINLKVIETSGGGCKGDTIYKNITINPAIGIVDFDDSNNLIIYPNPTTGLINLSFNYSGPTQISVFDALGKLVYQTSKISEQNYIKLDLSILKYGIYWINIINEDGTFFNSKIQLIK